MAKKVALVVDDEQFVLALASNILTDIGFTVTKASGGKEARMALRKREYDLIVSDNQFKGEPSSVWGVEVIKAAQQLGSKAKTLLMSSDQVEHHTADAFLLKPFLISEFTKAVESLMRTTPPPELS